MSLSLHAMLGYLKESAKQNKTGPIVCYWCQNRINFIKYGSYDRYSVADDELIRIQRYLCKHDQCRRTFSILPHPFLRITRKSLCIFKALLNMMDERPVIAELARQFGESWQSISRAITMGSNIMSWLDKEAQNEPSWAPSPCMHPQSHWSEFVEMFATKFYPRRYRVTPPTEYGNCL